MFSTAGHDAGSMNRAGNLVPPLDLVSAIDEPRGNGIKVGDRGRDAPRRLLLLLGQEDPSQAARGTAPRTAAPRAAAGVEAAHEPRSGGWVVGAGADGLRGSRRSRRRLGDSDVLLQRRARTPARSRAGGGWRASRGGASSGCRRRAGGETPPAAVLARIRPVGGEDRARGRGGRRADDRGGGRGRGGQAGDLRRGRRGARPGGDPRLEHVVDPDHRARGRGTSPFPGKVVGKLHFFNPVPVMRAGVRGDPRGGRPTTTPRPRSSSFARDARQGAGRGRTNFTGASSEPSILMPFSQTEAAVRADGGRRRGPESDRHRSLARDFCAPDGAAGARRPDRARHVAWRVHGEVLPPGASGPRPEVRGRARCSASTSPPGGSAGEDPVRASPTDRRRGRGSSVRPHPGAGALEHELEGAPRVGRAGACGSGEKVCGRRRHPPRGSRHRGAAPRAERRGGVSGSARPL